MPTHKKLRYLLTFVDTFSGWIEAFPTSRETADTVASILTQEIISRFGLPATIQSDNGPAFIAQVVQLVAKSLNISWKLHIPYHLQSSARIRATPWKPTGLSPFELLYGRPFLVSHNFPVQSPPLASYLPYLSLLRHLLREHADHTLPVVPGPGDSCPAAPLQPGDNVLLRELQTGSLQPRWSGPHIIILTTPMAAKLLGHTRWHLKMTSGNPNPWAPPTFASPAAPACQFLILRILLLTILLMSPLKASPYHAWQFYLQESWGEGPTTRTQYIAQVDCQPADCKSIRFEFPKSIANTLKCSQNNFGLCFLYDQTKIVCYKWSGIFGGCPYASCVMHKAPKSEMLVIDNQGKVSLTICDPCHAQWEKGTAGKIYTKYTNSHPSGTRLIYRSYTHTVPREIDQLSLLGSCCSRHTPKIFLSATEQLTTPAATRLKIHSLCTSGRILLVYWDLNQSYKSLPSPPLCTCYSSPSAKGIWVSRVSIPSYTSSSPCPPKQTSYLPPHMSSLVAAGIGSGVMGYSVTSAAQLEGKLCVAIEASAASLASLQ
ncbi:LOW QUALITY PROTEIN: Gag-Pol polyprotein [Plecturocebus cupreus]